jgi:hypothetical protein
MEMMKPDRRNRRCGRACRGSAEQHAHGRQDVQRPR